MDSTKSGLVLLVALIQLVFCRSEGTILPRSNLSGTAHIDVPGCSGELMVSGPPRANDSQPITITAFFPLPSRDIESTNTSAFLHYLLPAAVIAAENVNRALAEEGLYYHLQLDVRNSRCDKVTAVRELGFTEPGENRVAVLGPGCLDVISSVSPLAHRLSLPQVTYANETNVPIITEQEGRDLYPSLFLMIRNVYHTAKTALRLMHYFGWTEQVSFLFDDVEVYSKAVEQLVDGKEGEFTLIVDQNISIRVPEDTFEKIPLDDDKEESVRTFMQAVRRRLIRVIAGMVGKDTACRVMCEAKAGVIPGDGFAFVFIGTFQNKWWETCSCGLTTADVESVISVSSQIKNTASEYEFELGSNLSELKRDYLTRLNKWCPETRSIPPNTFFATTFDSVMALGLAIKNTLQQLNASQQNPFISETKETVFEHIYNSLANLSFSGASGRVSFSHMGERNGIDVVQQLQDGSLVVVGTYDSGSEALNVNESLLSWSGENLPQQFITRTLKAAPLYIISIVLTATIVSNVFAVILMLLAIRHRSHRLFRASSQRLNYFVFTGAYMAYITLYIYILLESVGEKFPNQLFTFFCIFRLYTIVLSFTLTFGTLFLRAWRIYRIFNNPFVARKKYTDSFLMLLVGALAAIDILMVTIYTAADSYGRGVTEAEPDYDSYTQCTQLGCFSRDYYLVGSFSLGGYKFLQMFLFIFVVSLVRRGVIERKIYDDSKYLAIALYVTAIFFFIGLPLQVLLLVSFKIAEGLIVNMVWVLTSTNVTLFAIYVPKLYQIIYKKVDVRKLMQQKSKFYLYSAESRSTIL